jgi:hypothetical protein
MSTKRILIRVQGYAKAQAVFDLFASHNRNLTMHRSFSSNWFRLEIDANTDTPESIREFLRSCWPSWRFLVSWADVK